jgi:hypothetical protein
MLAAFLYAPLTEVLQIEIIRVHIFVIRSQPGV